MRSLVNACGKLSHHVSNPAREDPDQVHCVYCSCGESKEIAHCCSGTLITLPESTVKPLDHAAPTLTLFLCLDSRSSTMTRCSVVRRAQIPHYELDKLRRGKGSSEDTHTNEVLSGLTISFPSSFGNSLALCSWRTKRTCMWALYHCGARIEPCFHYASGQRGTEG